MNGEHSRNSLIDQRGAQTEVPHFNNDPVAKYDSKNNFSTLPINQVDNNQGINSDALLSVPPANNEMQTLNGVKFGEVHVGITPSSFESRNTSICNIDADTNARNSKIRGS